MKVTKLHNRVKTRFSEGRCQIKTSDMQLLVNPFTHYFHSITLQTIATFSKFSFKKTPSFDSMQFSSKNRDAKIISELYKDPFKDKFDKERGKEFNFVVFSCFKLNAIICFGRISQFV